MQLVNPIAFIESYFIEKSVISNLKSFFNLDISELRLVLATLCVLRDRRFIKRPFTKEELIKMIYKSIHKLYDKEWSKRTTIIKLAEKEFFIFISNEQYLRGKTIATRARYQINEDKFRYFATILQVYIEKNTWYLRPIRKYLIKKEDMKKCRKDVVKHREFLKKISKKK